MLRMMFLCVPLCFSILLFGQKTLTSIKTSQAPHIDGVLDDACWKQAPIASNFIQNFPSYGSQALVKTEVKVLYDNEAVYIGAHLYDDPSQIRKQLTSRDGEQRQDVDYFSVFFDTYNDHQNGFQFLVTPNNVQSDAKLNGNASASFGDFGDKSWDAVWDSKTKLASDGWYLEMRIPYISLRFAKKEVQTWGLQFLRFTRRNNESSYWNAVDPNLNGFIDQFGQLKDLKNIQPPLRLSFSPYLSGGIRQNPEGSKKNKEWLRNGGMDVKYGINESFTLDATLIPDFGQVVSDNVVNNLSPFEIQFQENRPFFTEGTELFNKSGLFYSRRIGATPSGYYGVEALVNNSVDYEVVKNPTLTQLYNGIKFSGRNKKKLGIGIFNAVTAPMKAELRNIGSKEDTVIETEPLSNYNIIVLDQALKGRSSVTFTNTNVMRNGPARDANVSALDWSLYTNDNKFRLQGTARYSKIFGYSLYPSGNINLVYDTITRLGRIYVKPYDGYNTSLQLSKANGQLRYYAGSSITSHTYDPNDLGYLQTPNLVNYSGGISYNQFKPTTKFITYRYSFDVTTKYLYKPYRYNEVMLSTSGFWIFKNFWDVTVTVSSFPTNQDDYFELRTPGKYLKKPAEATFQVEGSTDSRKRLFINYELAYAPRAKADNNYNRTEFGVRYRFSDRLTLSTDVFRQFENNQIGYAFRRESNREPIVGYRDFTEIQSIVSGTYNFNSRLNVVVRGRHYWNKVKYNSFYNVDVNGNTIPRSFIPGSDENYNAFNLDAFITWDFRLGSRVILGWKNWLGDEYGVNGLANRSYWKNLNNSLSISHGNEITLRVIYFLDYNQLKKRH
jgi:hypothetical protein